MIDFILNSNGDLSFTVSDTENEQLQLDFFTSQNTSLFFDFYIENLREFSYLDNLVPGLIFNFETSYINYDKEVYYSQSEEDYLLQQIKIRLSSPLGTIMGNENIGSELDFYKHKNIDQNINSITDCIREAINDILPDAKIKVEKIDSGYFDYTNSLKITISNKDYNFYYYL